jgi:hypothetical protein
MTVVLLPQLYSATTYLLAGASEPPHFDLSNPKIFLGLVIGGSLPYFIPAIPAVLTKWLLFAKVFRLAPWPKFSRLCAVALMEVFCFAVTVGFRTNISFFIYPVAATFLNLILFQSADQRNGSKDYHYLKKSLYAFATGLIYLGYVVLFTLVGLAVAPYISYGPM